MQRVGPASLALSATHGDDGPGLGRRTIGNAAPETLVVLERLSRVLLVLPSLSPHSPAVSPSRQRATWIAGAGGVLSQAQTATTDTKPQARPRTFEPAARIPSAKRHAADLMPDGPRKRRQSLSRE
jgi:hypothetical protein